MTIRDARTGDYIVRCDLCERVYLGAQPTQSMARKAAQYMGWVVRDGRDLCPWCRDGEAKRDQR